MNHVDFLSSEITKRYGTITRARGYFLYTQKGVRLVDLYLEGGRAILGWKGSVFTVFKNVLNRGLSGSFDTVYFARLKKAVQDLLDRRCAVFVFNDKSAAISVALSFSKSGTFFWRPWYDASNNSIEIENDCTIIEPPFAWGQHIFILAVSQEIYEAHLASGADVPSSDRIPAPICAAISRAIYDLIYEIPRRGEKNWFVYDKIILPYWSRKGPYLFPKINESDYLQFVCHCLDCGIVISPAYNTPSIVPYGVDAGVFGKLNKNPFVCGE